MLDGGGREDVDDAPTLGHGGGSLLPGHEGTTRADREMGHHPCRPRTGAPLHAITRGDDLTDEIRDPGDPVTSCAFFSGWRVGRGG
jgi:hypothetical protein